MTKPEIRTRLLNTGAVVICAVIGAAALIIAMVTRDDSFADFYQQRIRVIAGAVAVIIGAAILLRLFAVLYWRAEQSERALAAKNVDLDAARQQMDATLASLVQGVCFFDENRTVVVANRRYATLYGLPEDAMRPGLTLRAMAELRLAAGTLPAPSADAYLQSVEEMLRAGQAGDTVAELADGRIICSHLERVSGRGWVVTDQDITDRRKADERIAFLARHDILTGLANRALFQERFEQAMAAGSSGFAICCLDLDRFKAINDTYGHQAGDDVLRMASARLKALVSEADTVARLGGDEFGILRLGSADVPETTALARRVVHALNQPFEVEGRIMTIGTSIGIALAPRDSLDCAQLLKFAGFALDRAKQEGAGTWQFFEPAMIEVAGSRRALEQDLRGVLPMGQLELHYQPLVRCRDRTLTGFEALIRWRHPMRGLVPPGEFIALAEDIGLINDLGAWVLQHACVEAATWPGQLRVAVNLSARQFDGRTLVPTVTNALRAAGLAASRLELEITESLPLQGDQDTLTTLRELHALGARITLDDFGTGYSQLFYLLNFPCSTIKIDRSFVRDIQSREDSAKIIRGIIGLAANLEIHVTAEGVETEAQYALLATAGCDEIQGFLISRPVPAAEVPALIARLSAPAAADGHALAATV